MAKWWNGEMTVCETTLLRKEISRRLLFLCNLRTLGTTWATGKWIPIKVKQHDCKGCEITLIHLWRSKRTNHHQTIHPKLIFIWETQSLSILSDFACFNLRITATSFSFSIKMIRLNYSTPQYCTLYSDECFPFFW